MPDLLEAEEALHNMITTFRVSELQTLLGFSGHNKHGNKQQLLERASKYSPRPDPSLSKPKLENSTKLLRLKQT